MSEVRPFILDIPEADLADLRARLANTRWPERETVGGWSQGTPLAELQALCAYWQDGYDWRRCEAKLNRLGQFKTEIDGLDIHFLHVRSPRADAMPLVMTHGWPGSVIEFMGVIEELANPADGGLAFHVVAPSLPRSRLFGQTDRHRVGCREDRPRLGRADDAARLYALGCARR